ncbi:RRP46 [Candida oxycetoniae]|uniref:RRP46 n=1 Tax=Candida oxycetoniae TaxID=497107 RepID=A0AAI9T1F6_9ASCO|nr:RRP46 [Candida oxycetoniae]KAI3406285.2 RRP46 [Candida oxycetoniae]
MFQVHTSILDNADGSAELTLDDTKVLVSVSGPIESKQRQELPQQASLEIIVRPAKGLSTTKEKLLEDKLRSLLQNVLIRYRYPRQLIQIVVQFLVSGTRQEFTNNELNAAINCCYFAIIDADLSIYSSFASVSLCINSGNLIENPTADVISTSDSHHIVCFSIENGKVGNLLLLESAGEFTEYQLFDLLAKSVRSIESLHQLQRKAIEKKLGNDYIWREVKNN